MAVIFRFLFSITDEYNRPLYFSQEEQKQLKKIITFFYKIVFCQRKEYIQEIQYYFIENLIQDRSQASESYAPKQQLKREPGSIVNSDHSSVLFLVSCICSHSPVLSQYSSQVTYKISFQFPSQFIAQIQCSFLSHCLYNSAHIIPTYRSQFI